MKLPETRTRPIPPGKAAILAGLESQHWPLDPSGALCLGACGILPAVGGGWIVCHFAAGQAVALCRTIWGACWLVGRLSPVLPDLSDARRWQRFAESTDYRRMLREGDALDQAVSADAPRIGECPNAVLQAIQGALDGVDVPGWMGPHDDIGRARHAPAYVALLVSKIDPHDDIGRARHALNTVYAGRACQLARQGIAIERACQLAWNELWHAPNMPEIIRHTLQGGTS